MALQERTRKINIRRDSSIMKVHGLTMVKPGNFEQRRSPKNSRRDLRSGRLCVEGPDLEQTTGWADWEMRLLGLGKI